MSEADRTRTDLGDHEDTATTRVDALLEITMHDPGPDTDTCKILLNRELTSGDSKFFETQAEASGWPMIQRLMRIPGLHSVIAKGNALIVAKHMGAEWPMLLQPIEYTIRSAFEPATEPSPVETIAAAAAGDGADDDLRHRVQEIIDTQINPSIAAHGGYISLFDVVGTRVFVHMGGGCQGCGMASATLKHGVESALRSQIPEITEILDATDHTAGGDPFYLPGT